MSATAVAAAPVAPTRSALLRGAAVVIAFAGPLSIGLVRGILPYDTVDDPTTIVEKITANPATQNAVLWLVYLALLTLPLGVVITGWLAMRVRPVLGTIAAATAWIGFLTVFALSGTDQIALAASEAGLPVSTAVTVSTAAEALPPGMVGAAVFVIGHILGAILLGVALWRVIPKWAALALIVSQPLHLLFAVGYPNHVLDAVAWSLTGVGFAAAALAAPALVAASR